MFKSRSCCWFGGPLLITISDVYAGSPSARRLVSKPRRWFRTQSAVWGGPTHTLCSGQTFTLLWRGRSFRSSNLICDFAFTSSAALRRASTPPRRNGRETRAVAAASLKLSHFAIIPASINLTGLPFSRPQVETVADVGGAMRGMEEVRVSRRFFGLVPGNYFKGATNVSTSRGKPPTERHSLYLNKSVFATC